MARAARALLAAGVILLAAAGPALAQQAPTPVIDFTDFMTPEAAARWADRNGDGLPDLPQPGGEGEIPAGVDGLWDDAVGALTPQDFVQRVDPDGSGFALDEQGAVLVGPCGGAVISFDAQGESLSAALDLGDGSPPFDVYGDPAFTAANPFRVDAAGTVAYFGFTRPTAALGGDAFHDHRWELVVMGVSAKAGGDPNPEDKNRNAGLVELGDQLPFQFQAKLKVRGAFVDRWGPADLPEYSAADLSAFAGHEYCFGEGWVQFVGDAYPLFTVPGALATALALAGFAGLLFARPALSWRA